MGNKLEMSSPWVSFYHQMDVFFGGDPDIKLQYDDEVKIIKMFVDNPEKAEALEKILPPLKKFGSVTVKIEIIPANELGESGTSLFRKALEGNPAFSGIVTVTDPLFGTKYNYVMFKRDVVQYWDDRLNDPHGRCTTLYQELAKEIFDDPHVFFCTE